MGIITDRDMLQKASATDRWLTDPAPRGAGRFMARISRGGERTFYFRYTTATGERDTLLIGSYDAKGKTGFMTLAAARGQAAQWSKIYREGARNLRQHFEKLKADELQAAEDARIKYEHERYAAEAEAMRVELIRQQRLSVRQVFEQWAKADLTPHVAGDGRRVGRKDGGQYVRDQFGRHVFPTVGDKAIADLRKADVLLILDEVKCTGKLRTANMLLADLKQMFRFAADRELIEHSPIALVAKRKIGGRDVKRDRALSDEELTALVAQLPSAHLHVRTERALWLILATGCRIGELMGSAWIEAKPHQQKLQTLIDEQNQRQKSGGSQLGFVDLTKRTWHMPTTKNQRAHTIHLSDFAIAQFTELKALRNLAGTRGEPIPWVFPNSQGTGPVNVKAFGKQIADRQRPADKRLQNRSLACESLLLSNGRWTAHDLRRTSATMMSKLDVPNDVINECQNHVKPGMIGLYNQDRRMTAQMRAFDTLGKVLAAMVSGKEPETNVVALRAA